MEIGAFTDIKTSKAASELQQKGIYPLRKSPVQTKDGRDYPGEFVSTVYLVGNRKVSSATSAISPYVRR